MFDAAWPLLRNFYAACGECQERGYALASNQVPKMRPVQRSENSATPVRGFLTDDAVEILKFAAEAFDAGHGAALVTLVEIRGGAARELGSQMAVRDDGLYCGYISGGCVEAAVAAEALTAIATLRDRYLKLGEGSRFFDIVLPCGGGITFAVHVLRESEKLRTVLRELAFRRRTGLLYDPGSQSVATILDAGPTGWSGDVFRRSYRPRIRVVLSGHSVELDAAARVSSAAGYDVLVHDQDAGRRPDKWMVDHDTAVVLLHHDLDREMIDLKWALDATPFYIGALGSSRTHEKRSARLASLGYGPEEIARIKAPIGIFPRARDAGSLALSILADIAAVRA